MRVRSALFYFAKIAILQCSSDVHNRPYAQLVLRDCKKDDSNMEDDESILPSESFAAIQEKVDSFNTTKRMGRLPFPN